MLRIIGISLYLIGLTAHYAVGSNDIDRWCSFYMLVQNVSLLLISLGCYSHKIIYKYISILATTYFVCTSTFYAYLFLSNKFFFFTESHSAKFVLVGFLAVSLILTTIHAYATRVTKRP